MSETLVPGTKLTRALYLIVALISNCYCLTYHQIDIYGLKILQRKHDINQQKQLQHASRASLYAIGGSADFKHRYLAKSASKDRNSRSFRGRITSISDHVPA